MRTLRILLATPRLVPPSTLLLASLLVVSGCGRSDHEAPAHAATASAPKPAPESSPDNNPGEKFWPLTGEIISVNAERKTLIVTHEEIKDYMPRMTMEFKVGAGDFANAKEGQFITARLYERDGEHYLERIWPADPATVRAIKDGAEELQKNSEALAKRTYTFREVGDTLPNFVLYDQNGRLVEIERFKGKRVVINFIYTRCPIVTMCPASTLRMMALQNAAKKAGITDFELVSITLDPLYDTPGVLKEYAAVRNIDTSNFSFLTGPESAIKNLLRQLSVTSYWEGGINKHSLATVLIGPDGKILHRDDSEGWDPKEFIQYLRAKS